MAGRTATLQSGSPPGADGVDGVPGLTSRRLRVYTTTAPKPSIYETLNIPDVYLSTNGGVALVLE